MAYSMASISFTAPTDNKVIRMIRKNILGVFNRFWDSVNR